MHHESDPTKELHVSVSFDPAIDRAAMGRDASASAAKSAGFGGKRKGVGADSSTSSAIAPEWGMGGDRRQELLKGTLSNLHRRQGFPPSF